MCVYDFAQCGWPFPSVGIKVFWFWIWNAWGRWFACIGIWLWINNKKGNISNSGRSFFSSLSCSIITYKYGFWAEPSLLSQVDKAASVLRWNRPVGHRQSLSLQQPFTWRYALKRAAALTLAMMQMRILCEQLNVSYSFLHVWLNSKEHHVDIATFCSVYLLSPVFAVWLLSVCVH